MYPIPNIVCHHQSKRFQIAAPTSPQQRQRGVRHADVDVFVVQFESRLVHGQIGFVLVGRHRQIQINGRPGEYVGLFGQFDPSAQGEGGS